MVQKDEQYQEEGTGREVEGEGEAAQRDQKRNPIPSCWWQPLATTRYTTFGTSASVGAAGGYMQGGGFPAMTGKYGSAADNVLEMDVVLADGTLIEGITACHPDNADLFWAIRGGGGGTFAVVTRVVYKTHPGPRILLDWDGKRRTALKNLEDAVLAGENAVEVSRKTVLELNRFDEERKDAVIPAFDLLRIEDISNAGGKGSEARSKVRRTTR